MRISLHFVPLQRKAFQFIALPFIAGLILSPVALAGPWLDPGDSGLRHDIQVLADAGVIRTPVSTWPLSWDDIGKSLDAPLDLHPAERAALARVRRRMRAATTTGEMIIRAHLSAAQSPREIRTFEDGPREDLEFGASLEWTGNRLAYRFQGNWVKDPEDDESWRWDGSYAGMVLGNWTLAASVTDRYWGPGWQSSMIFSNNARPIPSLSLERYRSVPYESRWLRWLGPWDFSLIFGFLENDRVISDAKLFASRFNVRPRQNLELGFSLMGLWCGSGQGCGADDFFDLVTGGGDSTSFDRLAGMDLRWSNSLAGRPFALYTHWVGEDFGDGSIRKIVPNSMFAQFGMETWGHWARVGSYRLYLEWAGTECDDRIVRVLTFDGGGGKPGCAYRNSVYQTGETYRGRSFGHSFDQDSSVGTLGLIVNDRKNHAWMATASYGELNRRGVNRSTVATNETKYREFELSYRRTLPMGDLSVGLGYEHREDVITGEDDADVRVFAEWNLEISRR